VTNSFFQYWHKGSSWDSSVSSDLAMGWTKESRLDSQQGLQIFPCLETFRLALGST